jgi:hypothetical protein
MLRPVQATSEGNQRDLAATAELGVSQTTLAEIVE